MKLLSSFFFVLLLVPVLAAALPDPYDVLKNANSYSDLIYQKGLNCYNAPLSFEGKVYNRMAKEALKRKLTKPMFEEIFLEPNQYKINIINRDYSPILKNIILDLFSPLKIFNYIINKLEDKRAPDKFPIFKKKTIAEIKEIENNRYKLTFTSKDNRMDFQTSVLEDHIEESWTKKMVIIIAQKTGLVENIAIVTQVLSRQTGSRKLIDEKTTKSQIKISYKKINNRHMPVALELNSPDKSRIILEATYMTKGSFSLFASKSFAFFTPEIKKADRAYISYGKYKINSCSEKKNMVKKNDTSVEAKKLFTKGQEAIMNGKISKAKSIFKEILKKYPSSPEASEADALLEGLP